MLHLFKLIGSGQANYFPFVSKQGMELITNCVSMTFKISMQEREKTNEHQGSPAGYWVWATLSRPVHSIPQKCDRRTTHVHYFLQTNIRKWYSKGSMSSSNSCVSTKSFRLSIWRVIRLNFAKFYTNRKSDNIKLMIFTASTCHRTLFSPQLCNIKTRGVAQETMLLLWT